MAKITAVSPLAPASFPDLPVIAGVRLGTAEAGVRYKGRTDVMLAVLDPGTAVAGVFTRSATRSAPVLDCQAKLGGDSSTGAAILVNSGNSNAFTGQRGQMSVKDLTEAAAKTVGIPASRVFTASTGVIGEPLPHEKIIAKLDELNGALTAEAIKGAAKAIMTTDTFPKGAGRQIEIDGKTVSISGIAKGSGMIAPDMATMLVYIFTDAAHDQAALQALLAAECDRTFNCITVDSDTSTSDSLMLCATGASGVDATGNAAFGEALHEVMLDLAHQVVKDGEGATKFVEIRVTGAASAKDAKVHGMAIANSPLVKTAIAGEDPNWGRVVMAIGKSGAAADRDALSIWFGDILVAEKGWVSPSYVEADAAAHMKQQELLIRVDLGLGDGAATVWTCDLTHGYIDINADYRS
ncbi:bifunctional glutamate N-acetyltransferase/amino-acid acetyltransferase ArgJ [Albibacillus kandeliae]|uniref:bifunctional glutamate N-acetyltransferase/amino-acid acetyltransferase ArgJ n=1 Tax=Albibacillus kandeliae TaxID=2174228 RepID=UPI000D68F122|nr:bifunctional glutamate N-acetyltransferase/amino-acid acetyltransferase ArgJ [Albibacillus kandeliae]